MYFMPRRSKYAYYSNSISQLLHHCESLGAIVIITERLNQDEIDKKRNSAGTLESYFLRITFTIDSEQLIRYRFSYFVSRVYEFSGSNSDI